MNSYYDKVQRFLLELNYTITKEVPNEGLLLVKNDRVFVDNMAIVVSPPMVVVEQHLVTLRNPSQEVYCELLKKNREIVHGAFALDESGTKLYFRNTHECENLDLNELEATLNSLSVLIFEYSDTLTAFSKP